MITNGNTAALLDFFIWANITRAMTSAGNNGMFPVRVYRQLPLHMNRVGLRVMLNWAWLWLCGIVFWTLTSFQLGHPNVRFVCASPSLISPLYHTTNNSRTVPTVKCPFCLTRDQSLWIHYLQNLLKDSWYIELTVQLPSKYQPYICI